MNSERSNQGKEKLIEDDDHCPSQNNLPGSDNQQKKFGVSRGATEAVVSTGGDIAVSTVVSAVSAAADGASCSHSASEKLRTELRPLSDFVDQINTCHLQWTEKLHNHFVSTTNKLGRFGKKVTPKALIEAMAITGLTTKHVKSRLQAFRKGRITETNWQAPRGPRHKNNKAGKIDGRKSASKSASTSSREHDPNGPGMGDQNVAVTAQQQPHHDFNQNKSPEQIQNHLELGERSRTVSAGHQQPSQVDVADISAANGYSIPGPCNNSTISTAINNVQGGQQEQLYGVTNGIARANGYSIPGPYNNSAHWVQPAQAGGVGLQEPTSNGYSIPGPYNNSTISTAINNVQGSQQEQLCGVTNGIARANGYSIPGPYNNSARWVQPAQAGGVGLQEPTSNGYSIPGPYNNSTSSTAINNVQDSLQEQLCGVTNGIARANDYSIPGPYNNSAHWVQPAQAGGVGLQEPTSNGYSIPGPYNNSTSSTAINNVQDSLQEQNGVGLQIQTPGFQDRNGFFYPFQPGNHNHWVQFAQYCVGLQVQTPGFRHQNGVYNFEPGNELACVVQPTQYGVGVQEQTPGLQYQIEVYNFQPENELARVVQPAEDGVPSRLYNQNEVYNIQAGNEIHMVQQPAQDGGSLGNIQQQNQPQVATDTVQAQNATAITPDNMVTTEDLVEDFLNLDSSDFDFSEPFGFAGLPL
ncbi:hypothetical protein Q3G72_027037 [Acer saccharum]|nr:hypothetical protein Q3G72_027037 [Acer saccharum]